MKSIDAGVAIRDVVADVVAEVAEEELFLINALATLDDEAVVKRLTAREQRRDPLGFGAETAAAVVTSIVWIALTEAVCKLVDSAVDRLGEAKRRRRRKAVPTSVPPLTRDQLAAVKAAIVAAARKAGLSESRTDVIAQATVSRLVLAPAEAEKGRNSEAAS